VEAPASALTVTAGQLSVPRGEPSAILELANVARDLREIVVELMVTIGQSADMGGRDGAGV